mmetsp:Transcript_96131/g.310058  ORF Transcript_96131/g.310058 Transcript_96131/m.310058 type:complete len:101 (-) Transcript_96131:1037-1339(-)
MLTASSTMLNKYKSSANISRYIKLVSLAFPNMTPWKMLQTNIHLELKMYVRGMARLLVYAKRTDLIIQIKKTDNVQNVEPGQCHSVEPSAVQLQQSADEH